MVKFSKEKNVQNVFHLNKNVVFRSLWGYHRKSTFLHIRIAIAELDNVGIVLSFFRGGGVLWWLNIGRVEHSLIAQITLTTSPTCSVRSNMSLESLAIVVLTNHHHAGIFLFTR